LNTKVLWPFNIRAARNRRTIQEKTMFQIRKTARLVAATAVCGALALPAIAQDRMAPKMSGSKMVSGKTLSKAAADRMMMGKMMSSMTAAEKKTFTSMSPAEKALFMKMLKPRMVGSSKMMGSGKMSGKM
jgi:hypothetical protein